MSIIRRLLFFASIVCRNPVTSTIPLARKLTISFGSSLKQSRQAKPGSCSCPLVLILVALTFSLSCTPSRHVADMSSEEIHLAPGESLVISNDLLEMMQTLPANESIILFGPAVRENRNARGWGYRNLTFKDCIVWPSMREASLNFDVTSPPLISSRAVHLSLHVRGEDMPISETNAGGIECFLNNTRLGVLPGPPVWTFIDFPVPPGTLISKGNILTFRKNGVANAEIDGKSGKTLMTGCIISEQEQTGEAESLFYRQNLSFFAPVEFGFRICDSFIIRGEQQSEIVMTVPQDAVLDFRWAWSKGDLSDTSESRSEKYSVELSIVESSERTSLWKNDYDPLEQNPDTWTLERLSLSRWSGKQVRLIFSTSASENEHSPSIGPITSPFFIWGHPLLLQKRITPHDRGKTPDIVLLLLDTLRSDRLGCYGDSNARTPAIDKLAKRSVTCANVTSQAPNTLASVSSLMSGVYPTITTTSPGLEHTGSLDGKSDMSNNREDSPAGRTHHVTTELKMTVEQPTNNVIPGIPLARRFSDAGYRTVGYSTNPLISRTYGFDQGFSLFDDSPLFASGAIVAQKSYAQRIPRLEKPSFLYLHFMDPHSPYRPPDEFLAAIGQLTPENLRDEPWNDEKQYAKFYAMEVWYNDIIIGHLLEDIYSLTGDRNALVVLTADHGEEFQEHGRFFHNSSLFREQITVPLLISNPENSDHRTTPGLIIEDRLALFDINETLSEIIDPGRKSQGPAERIPMVRGPHSMEQERTIFSELRNMELLDEGELIAAWQGNWKLIVSRDGSRLQLFNTERDPREINDRAEHETTIVEQLRQQIFGNYLTRPIAPLAPIDRSSLTQDLKALGYIE